MSDIVSTANLHDAYGEDLQSLAVQMQNFGGVTGFTGMVRTVRCDNDSSLVNALLESDGAGSVLVIDGGGSLDTALLGDFAAAQAADNGWAGVIVFGAVRDTVALSTLPFGVKALGSNPANSRKEGVGEVDVNVVIGGVTFRPGALVWCDADGVLVER